MNRFTEGSHVHIDIPDTTDPDHVRYHRIKVTIEQVRTVLEGLAAEYADEMGVEYEGLNWRLSMAPPQIAKYVVVHELAHHQEPNHTKEFWRLVGEYDPDYAEHADWLDENSARLVFSDEDL